MVALGVDRTARNAVKTKFTEVSTHSHHATPLAVLRARLIPLAVLRARLVVSMFLAVHRSTITKPCKMSKNAECLPLKFASRSLMAEMY